MTQERGVGLNVYEPGLPPPARLPVGPSFPWVLTIQVSFTSEFAEDPSLLVPSWQGNGCDTCVEFSSGFPRAGGAYVNASIEGYIGGWEEQAVLQASDRRSGDRFGASIALDQVNNK